MKWPCKKSILSWVAIPVLLITLIFPITSNPVTAADKTYKDVSPSNPHYGNIMSALEREFMTGYSDGTFRPDAKLTRGQVVLTLGKYVVKTSGKNITDFDLSNVQPFNDVPATHSNQELYRYSLIVKQADVFHGSNNNLMPNDLITRQQASKVVTNAFDLAKVSGKVSKVADIHLASPQFRPFIEILSENNILIDGNFYPNEFTKREQFASFMIGAHIASDGSRSPTPKPDPKTSQSAKPVSVEPIESIKITNIQIPQLPATVLVKYDNNSLQAHNVTWNTAPFDFRKTGIYNVQGAVEKTAFTATIQVTVTEFNLIPFPGLNPDLPHEQTDKYFTELPNRIKASDNAMAAFGVWAEAFNEVNRLKKLDTPTSKLYDIPKYERILAEQQTIIAQWQSDINKAKTEAIEAINNLPGKIKTAKSATEARVLYLAAKAKMDAIQKLDKTYKPSKLIDTLTNMQKVVNDWTELEVSIKQMTIEIPNPTAQSPHIKLGWPTDKKIESAWAVISGGEGINKSMDTLIRDTRFILPESRIIDLTASVSKGAVTLSLEYSVVLSPNPEKGAGYRPAFIKATIDL